MIMRPISRLYFWLSGWKLEGSLDPSIKKCIMVGAPPTSNFEFSYSGAGLYRMRLRMKYLVKQEVLKMPWGLLFMATGAIGVQRDKSDNLVRQMVELFERSEELVILLAPEGSRKLKGKWKTGFYHAALEAKVPIVLSSLDYKKKIAHVGPAFHPTGDYRQDMQQVIEYYKNITPRFPEKFALNII